MSLSISQELKQTFHMHALRREARMLLTGRQWDQYNQLTERCQKASEKEELLFNERFSGRVDQEYRKLLNERTAKTKDFTPIHAQEDIFDKTALLKQADTNVRNRHEQRIAGIQQYEERGIETLLQRSTRENQLTGQSKDAFARAADRRSGEERRMRQRAGNCQPPTRRQTR